MTNEIAAGTAFNPVSLMPQTFSEKYQMAKVLSCSGLIPQGLNTPEKVCVALEWGHELQLSPMVAVQNIAVINGKPTLSADIMAAVVKRSPEFGGIEWRELTDRAAECVVTRRSAGYTETTVSRFTFDDAVKAGLTGKDVWKRYPKRMLKHRCLSYALRDAFPDILAGLYNPEEMGGDIDSSGYETERNVTPTDGQPCVTAGADEPAYAETKDADEGSARGIPDSARLESLLRSYGEQLQDTSHKPSPYEQAYEVLQTGSDGECGGMYDRCVAWLRKKGISVKGA